MAGEIATPLIAFGCALIVFLFCEFTLLFLFFFCNDEYSILFILREIYSLHHIISK